MNPRIRSELTVGLVGEQISGTLLPDAFDIMCRQNGLNLSFELIDVSPGTGFDLISFITNLNSWDWDGVSVTHPFKIAAAGLNGVIPSDAVQRLGSANVLKFDDDGVCAFNTDYTGFISAWRTAMGSDGPGRVIMAGAGGVASALGPALIDLGAEEVMIFDVISDRAETLAGKLGPKARPVSVQEAAEACHIADGLLNATECGMGGDNRSAFGGMDVSAAKWAFDAVYFPEETPFVQAVRAGSARVLTGFELFKHMAIQSFAHYAGVETDPAFILPKLEALRNRR
ncbi:MAG: hypothetical protein AAF401_08535 [Pseudomonadota bacterium]